MNKASEAFKMYRINDAIKMYYRAPKPSVFDNPFYKNLPEAYKKFYYEWKIKQPEAVHYLEEKGRYIKDEETGQVRRTQNIPIRLRKVPQMDNGLWGGEWVVQGYLRVWVGRKRKHDLGLRPKFWIPHLRHNVVYSEVLDKRMSCVVTPRAIDLIHANFGLDHYLLKTPACDIVTMLGLRLKRKLMHTIRAKEMYPEDEERREEIYAKYSPYLEQYTDEEIDWYGLTLKEAERKWNWLQEQEKKRKTVPLKVLYRQDIFKELKEFGIEKEPEVVPWWKRTLISFK